MFGISIHLMLLDILIFPESHHNNINSKWFRHHLIQLFVGKIIIKLLIMIIIIYFNFVYLYYPWSNHLQVKQVNL